MRRFIPRSDPGCIARTPFANASVLARVRTPEWNVPPLDVDRLRSGGTWTACPPRRRGAHRALAWGLGVAAIITTILAVWLEIPS